MKIGRESVESEPRSGRPCTSQNEKLKMSLRSFFYSRGIVHHEYAPEGQAINKKYYLGVLG